MVNNIGDVNNAINKGLAFNPMMNVNPIIPMNFPFVSQINQIPNMTNIQRNNIGNIPQNNNNNNNSNNINNANRTNF